MPAKSDKDFVTYFGERWAPVGVENDPNNLNKNWIPNVKKFHSSYIQCEGIDCVTQGAAQTQPQQKPPTAPSPSTQTQTAPDTKLETPSPQNPITAPSPKIPPLRG